MRLSGSVYNRPTPVPKMPPGLVELMEGLTKDVLKHNPADVYEFCAIHMEKLLEIRDGPSPKKVISLEKKVKKAQDKIRQRSERHWQRYIEELKSQMKVSENDSDTLDKMASDNELPTQTDSFTKTISTPKQHDLMEVSEIEISCDPGIDDKGKHNKEAEDITESVASDCQNIEKDKSNNQAHDIKNAENFLETVSEDLGIDKTQESKGNEKSTEITSNEDSTPDQNQQFVFEETPSLGPLNTKEDIDNKSNLISEIVIQAKEINTTASENIYPNADDSDNNQKLESFPSNNIVISITPDESTISIADEKQIEDDSKLQVKLESSGQLNPVVETISIEVDDAIPASNATSVVENKGREINILSEIETFNIPVVVTEVDTNETDSQLINKEEIVANLLEDINDTTNTKPLNIDAVEITDKDDKYSNKEENLVITELIGQTGVDTLNKTDEEKSTHNSDENVINFLMKPEDLVIVVHENFEEINNSSPDTKSDTNKHELQEATEDDTVKQSNEISSVNPSSEITPENHIKNRDSNEIDAVNIVDKPNEIEETPSSVDNSITEESNSIVEGLTTDFSDDTNHNNSTNTMDLETAAVTIQKVFRTFLFKSRASTFEDSVNDDNNLSDDDDIHEQTETRSMIPSILNKDRRTLGISRMDTVLQTVNEEKSLSLSTDDSSLSSAATIIQAHVRGFLVRNKLHSGKTASSNKSLVISDGPSATSQEEDVEYAKNKTVLNIHIVSDGNNFRSRDESTITSMDLSLDGSPPSSVNLHPLGYDKSERRKQLKREDAIQSVSPPSNNSGKLSEDVESVKEVSLNPTPERGMVLKNDSNVDTELGSLETTPTTSVTLDTVVDDRMSNKEMSSPEPEPEILNIKKSKLSKQSSDEMDVVIPDKINDIRSECKETEIPKLLHSSEFHDAVLPTKVSRSDTPLASEFKNVMVYFLLWKS